MIGLLRGRRGRRVPSLGAASAKPASIWELPGEPAVYALCSDPASGGASSLSAARMASTAGSSNSL
jgi:hypothetical protein